MIKNITISAPVRVDLCGGTLDIWPLNLIFEGSKTINLAMDAFCHVKLRTVIPEFADNTSLPSDQQQFTLKFFQSSDGSLASSALKNVGAAQWPSVEAFWQQPREQVEDLCLIPYTILKYFKPRGVGLQLEVITQAPLKSGLAGSSSLMVAMTKAFETAFRPHHSSEPEDLILLCRDLEASVMQFMAGVQDYYPAVYGGLNTIHLPPQKAQIERHPQETFNWLKSKIFVVDSLSAHHSGATNWQVIKALLEGDTLVRQYLQRINQVTGQFYQELSRHNFEGCAENMNQEWAARKQLSSLINTSKIDEIIHLGMQLPGVKSAKVCGAGNGGCVIFWVEEVHSDWKKMMHETLKHLNVSYPPIQPTAVGLQVTSFVEEGTYLYY